MKKIRSGARVGSRFEQLEFRRLFATVLPRVISANGELSFKNELPEAHSLWTSGQTLSPASQASSESIAINFIKSHANQLGIDSADATNPLVTNNYWDDSTNLTHVYLQQRVNNIPVLDSDYGVHIDPQGRIVSLAGGFVPNTSSIRPTQTFSLTPDQALSIASTQLGLTRTTTAGQAGTSTLINDSGVSIDPINFSLAYAPTAKGLELGWEFVLNVPGGDHWYDVSVGMNTRQLTFASDWVDSYSAGTTAGAGTQTSTTSSPKSGGGSTGGSGANLVDGAKYNVIAPPNESPQDGGFSIVTDPASPTASPFGWHDTNGVAGPEFTDTRGNNVDSHLDRNNDNVADPTPVRPTGGAALDFSTYTLDPAQAPTVLQNENIAQVNLFYINNLLHDVHYKYGFTEAAGNFQVNNYGNGGAASDAVQADAEDGGGTDNANFATPADGTAGRMQMYIFTATSPQRDGDLDNDVIIHEYGHGVSNRLTGGPANSNALSATQSGGMGEGWSDFYSLMFQQRPTDTQNAAFPVGTYVEGQPVNGPGIRRKPYSYDMSVDPLTIDAYGTTGTTAYGVVRSTEVHNSGELWATTLWDMNWNLINKYGYDSNIANGYNPAAPKGNTLTLKLVMDAMKLQPANPSFKDARDAILQADQNLTGGANTLDIYKAFARRGMGVNFVDTSSAATSVTPDFNLPIADPYVNSATPTGTTLAKPTSITFNFNQAINPASFTIADDVTSFVGPGNVNILPSITGFTWVNTSTLQVNFNISLTGSYSMKIGPNILAADDGHAMDQNGNGTPGEAADAYTDAFVFTNTLGPEGFGYKAAKFPIENIDLVPGGAGVTTLLDAIDDGSAAINLGTNTFNYYGTSLTGASSLFGNSNGLLTTVSAATEPSYTNTDLTSAPTQRAIAVLWDDWVTNNTTTASGADNDAVLYKLDDTTGDSIPDRLIIEWSSVRRFSSTASPATFQAILQLNTGAVPGQIILNYPDLVVGSTTYDNGASATVGIKDTGTPGANRLLVTQDNNTQPWVQTGSAMEFALDVTAPTVTASAYQYLNGHDVTVTFSENVGPSIALGDFTLVNTTTSQTINPAGLSVAYNSGTNTATLHSTALLPDGNYSLTLLGTGIKDATGNYLDGDGDLVAGGNGTVKFYVLAGDADRNRSVDINDLGILAANWQGSGKTFAQGDFNYDGTVDINDLGILAANWQHVVPSTFAFGASASSTDKVTRIADGIL